MRIQWLGGHACFLLTTNNAVKILIDPYDTKIGYQLPKVAADIVTTSHDHFEHNNIQAVTGQFRHFSQPGKFSQNGLEVSGTLTFHDSENGVKRGRSIIYKFTADGIDQCHCGDLGHVLTPEQVAEIGHVDILMIPVGGYYTIDAVAAAEVVKLLKPQIIIPMHFRTAAFNPPNVPIDEADRFVSIMGGGQKPGVQVIELQKEDLPTMAGVTVLDYC